MRIKSALLQSALEQAYKNSLLTGRYPGCVLFVDLSFASVDVNVHPAKTEIKFAAERQVFDMVYHAVLSALNSEERHPAVKGPAPVAEKAAPAPAAPVKAQAAPAPAKSNPRPDFYRTMSAEEFRAANYSISPTQAKKEPVSGQISLHSPATAYRVEEPAPSFTVSKAAPEAVRLETTGFDSPEPLKAVEKPVQNVESEPSVPHKIVGEALKTYIIVEQGENVIFIDKHAAHERMIFDRLKSRGVEIMSQTLLSPVTLRLSGEQQELLEKHGQLLSSLGFEIDCYGESDWILRGVPADMLSSDAAAALEETLEKLGRGSKVDPSAARDEILHTVACKAAIKAGWDTEGKELEALVDEVLSGRVKYCPHGRPVSVSMSRRDLDRQFKRIV